MKKLFFLLFVFLSTSLQLFAHYSAGILPYAQYNNSVYVLLGEEIRSNYAFFQSHFWSDFGGKGEPEDQNNIKQTAAREFSEETVFVFGDGDKEESINYIKRRLHNAPSLSNGEYTMFLVEVDYIPVEEFINAENEHKEKIGYMWLPLINLFEYAQSPRSLVSCRVSKKPKTKLFPKMTELLETSTGMIELRNILEQYQDMDPEIQKVLAKKPKGKSIIKKLKKVMNTFSQFKPIMTIANFF